MSSQRARMLIVVGRFKWVHIDYVRRSASTSTCSSPGPARAGSARRPTRCARGCAARPSAASRRSGPTRCARTWRAYRRLAARRRAPHVLQPRGADAHGARARGRQRADRLRVPRPGDHAPGRSPGSPRWELERDALAASDAQVVVSDAMLRYYETATSSTSASAPSSSRTGSRGAASRRRRPSCRRRTAGCTSRSSAPPTSIPITAAGTATSSGAWSTPVRRALALLRSRRRVPGAVPGLASELDDYHEHPTVPHRMEQGCRS